MAQHTVLFVCPHGAGKSRVAAAWFDGCASGGWRATSSGSELRTSPGSSAVTHRQLVGPPPSWPWVVSSASLGVPGSAPGSELVCDLGRWC